MKIISWNVNGIRSVLNKGFLEFVKEQDADVIHIQEAKIDDETFNLSDLKSLMPNKYQTHTHFATRRKGYSGLITLSKNQPMAVTKGIGIDKFDIEGRFMVLEYPDFMLVNVYFPNTSRDLSKLDFKKEFNYSFLDKINAYKKPLIISGDFNVAHTPKDIARPKENEGNAGYTIEERDFFTDLLNNGYTDSFRHHKPNEIKYSWWLQGFNARARNIGWRIDYHVVSNNIKNKIGTADILTNIHGSDHCPVLIELKLT